MAVKADLLGMTFGYLTVVAPAEASPSGGTRWACKCVCGRVKPIGAPELKRGLTKSCGCKSAEMRRAANTRHGMTETSIYKIWSGMRSRCLNSNSNVFSYYGGKGVRICERWEAFEAFLEDMGPTYRKGLSIERVDVNGDYEPSNCTWIARSEQALNRTNTVRLETPWGHLSIKETAKKIGVSDKCLQHRLSRGWGGDKLFQP